jgi:1,4-dihydroxy-2-naphthoate polyprenyltransferase
MTRSTTHPLVSKMRAYVALMRLREVVPFVLATTLLGANVAGAQIGLRLLDVVLANVLIVAFAFMINDVEDAADDALTPQKARRNPISAKRLSPRSGYWASAIVAALALALYATLGLWPLVSGALCAVLGFLYSWRTVRLKVIPLADLLSHGLMLAVLQFTSAYTAFKLIPPADWNWLAPCLFVFAVSLYGQLYNQLRDLEGDRKAGLRHTAARIGSRATTALMVILAVAALCLLGLSVWQRTVPLWIVLAAMAATLVIFFMMMRKVRQTRTAAGVESTFNEPIVLLGCLLMVVWLFVG